MNNAATAAPTPLFPLGSLYATPGAIEALNDAGQDAIEFLRRHQHGDWGDLSDDDKHENEFSISRSLRIFSAYHTAKGEKIWVITEADHSATTVLLPSEY
ncbi:MAG: hypothetical protein ACJ74J_05375 [Blastocatellia bacterium]